VARSVRQIKYQKQRYDERKAEAHNTLGNKCAECGNTNENYLRMVYRTDQLKGTNWPTRMFDASREKFDTELAKCELLCTRCYNKRINR